MPIDADAGASLIDLAGTPDFGERLLDLAASIAGIEEVFAYAIDNEGARPLACASALDHQDVRVREYARRFYLQDPANYDLRQTVPHSRFTQTVGADKILPRDYRSICFEQPNFAGKLCYGWRGVAHTIVLNYYTRHPASSVHSPELTSLSDLALCAMNRRLHTRDTDNFVGLIEIRLAAEFPLLTCRERQVIARTILGSTAEDTAHEIGVSKVTVLTYRQRAYQRYECSNAATFVRRLI